MTQLLPAGLSPGVLLIIVGTVVGLVPAAYRNVIALAGILISAVHLSAYGMPEVGAAFTAGKTQFADFTLTLVQVDKLSLIFAAIFHIAAFLNVIYGWRHAKRIEASMGLIYAGAAVGGVLAGDLLTLFVYWEIAALSSVFVVWAGGGHAAFKAGVRYLVVQVLSGLLLLAGIVTYIGQGHDLGFGAMAFRFDDGGLNPASVLFLLSFGIKAAFPALHTWQPDSYPKTTAVGAVILQAFTPNLAVYALARSFAGLDLLIVLGCIMTIYPVFFALIENDLRKVLAYSSNNQYGFMVCGIGIGTPLAMNGAVSHAFVHVLFKGLLFMSMGAVMTRVGTTKATELGGLHKSMPWTTVFCIVGAMAISAFPLFSGFATKSMIILASGEQHILFAYLILLFASAGVLEHSGIKIPYFAFFAHDQFAPSLTGKPRPKEAPVPMLLAMGIAAFLSIFIGVQPQYLLNVLPFTPEHDYHVFTADHVVLQMQLLMFAILAFGLLIKFNLYPPEIRSTILDVDWLWRVPGRQALMAAVRANAWLWHLIWRGVSGLSLAVTDQLYRTHGPDGRMARSWTVGYTALWTAVVLGAVLIAVLVVNRP